MIGGLPRSNPFIESTIFLLPAISEHLFGRTRGNLCLPTGFQLYRPAEVAGVLVVKNGAIHVDDNNQDRRTACPAVR
jgi:hypothetical protein